MPMTDITSAEVDASTEKRSNTELRVRLKITEGKKVLIKNIRFEGNKAFSDRKLKKAMETGEKMDFFLADRRRHL